MRQVFAVCDQFGFGKIEDYTHISFGYVTVKGQGKMSSRKGNVVYIDDLLDAAKEIIEEKITNEEFDEETKENISEILGIGAVKYSILKVGRTKDTAFDFKTSLSFEGDSGPYLVYTFARCKSILRNSGIDLNILKDKENTLSEKEELELAKHIFKFPEIIEDAALNYAPNIVATYLYELAQYFNQFYTKHSVLKAENENYKYTRIKLVASVAQVLQNGLNLLGIETVEKM